MLEIAWYAFPRYAKINKNFALYFECSDARTVCPKILKFAGLSGRSLHTNLLISLSLAYILAKTK